MTKDQKVIVGFLCGAAVGALAGLLLAPDSGEETRKKIANKAKDLKDDLNDQLTSTFGRISEQVNASLGWSNTDSNGDSVTRKLAKEALEA
jgi:gas vesicle protein